MAASTTSPTFSGRDIKPLAALLAILVAARLLYILLMPATYSKDLFSWLNVIDILNRGGNPYSETGVLNWPPFWMQILFVVGKISAHTGITATHLIQSILIGGEALCAGLCYGMMRRHFGIEKPFRILLFGLALNPVSIFLSCQHCNFDVLVGFWILLALWMLLDVCESGLPASWLLACFFLGMGILCKTVPMMLTPLLMLCARRQKAGILLAGLFMLMMPVTIGMSVLYTLGPAGVKEHVLGYRSMAGWYGIGGILGLLDAGSVAAWYQRLSPALFMGFMLAVFLRFRRAILSKAQVLTIASMLMIAVPTFGPGYSPPYVLWALPMLVIFYSIAPLSLRRILIALYVVAIATYCIEYAFFDSHGAFLVKMLPSPKMEATGDMLGARKMQAMIRLPMFGMYVLLFFRLLRWKNAEAAATLQ